MKKFLVLILSVVAVFAAILSLTACDNKNDNGGTTITDVNKSNDNIGEFSKNLRYELNDDKTGYVLTGIGLCEDVNIVMPSSYNNLPIVGIGEQAFYLNKSIIDIIISDNVENIGYEAFWNCSSLESVTIGNGVKSIGKKAFYSCYSIEAINYKGSKEQWNSISKGSDWNYGTGSFTINYNYVEN